MADPLVVVEVAFDNLPTDPESETVWTDVTSKVRAVETTRGRSQELDQYQAGRAIVTLSNADRRFDPTYTAGPYYGKVLPMKKVRIRALQSGQAFVPGASGYLSTPDVAAISPTSGVLDVRIEVSLPNWASMSGPSQQFLFRKAGSYEMRFRDDGGVIFLYTTGVGNPQVTVSPTGANFGDQFGWTSGQRIWFRARHTSASGLVEFFYATSKAGPYIAMGSGSSLAGSIVDTANALVLGSNSGSEPLLGNLYGFTQIDDGVTVVDLDLTDTSQWVVGDDAGDTGTDTTGKVFTVAGSGLISATPNEATYPIFQGFVDTWEQQYKPPSEAVCVLQVTDGFKVLQGTDVNISPFGLDGDTTKPAYWWRLDETVGSTVVLDSVAGVQGTVNGGVLLGQTGLLNYDANTAASWLPADNTTDFVSATGGVVTSGVQSILFKQNHGSGDTGNGVVGPDVATFDGNAQSIDIRVRLKWPGANGLKQYLFGKGGGTGVNAGYHFSIDVAGKLSFTATGSTGTSGTATLAAAPTLTVGNYVWVAVTLDNTSGNLWAPTFYTATAAAPNVSILHADWTSLGSPSTMDLASGTLAANAVLPAVGAQGATGSSPNFNTYGRGGLQTNLVEVALRSSINGTLVANPIFSAATWAVGEDGGDTGVDVQGNTWEIRNNSGDSASPIIVSASGAAPMSISALVKFDTAATLTSTRHILSQGTVTAGAFWRLYMTTGGTVAFEINSGAGVVATATSTSVVNDGETHHVVVTYSPTGVASIWVDGGTAEGTDTDSVAISSTALRIGHRNPATSGQSWAGTIDEVQIWNYELAQADVVALYALTVTPWSGDTTGARLGRILDAVGWASTARDIDTGDAVMQSQALQGTALDLAQNVAYSELFGALFIDRSGNVKFIQRTNQYGLASSAAFGDEASADQPIQNLTPDYGDWLIRNDVTIGRTGGADQRARDVGSIALYYPHSYTLGGLNNNSDALCLLAAQKVVEQYRAPKLRVAQVVVKPRKQASLFPATLNRELGEWIDVEWTPQGVGTPIVITSVVEKITHSISSGQQEWTVTFDLSPAPVGISAVAGAGASSPAPPGAPVVSNETLQGQLDVLATDTAWVTSGFSMGTNWTALVNRYRILGGKLCEVQIEATRTTSTLTFSATGGLTDNTVITVPAAARLSTQPYVVAWRSTATGGSGQIDTAGVVKITDGHPTSTIPSGDTVQFCFTYLLG